MDRAGRYLEAGADVSSSRRCAGREDMQMAARSASAAARRSSPTLVEGGKTPILSAAELEALGFGIAIFTVLGPAYCFFCKGSRDPQKDRRHEPACRDRMFTSTA